MPLLQDWQTITDCQAGLLVDRATANFVITKPVMKKP
jgi:hypothetical protein